MAASARLTLLPPAPVFRNLKLVGSPAGEVTLSTTMWPCAGGSTAAGWMLLLTAPDESPSTAFILMEIEAPGKLLAPRPVPHPDASVVPFARWPPKRMLTRQFLLFAGPVHAAAESGPELTVNVMVSSD